VSDKIEFTPEFIAAQREIIQSATDGNWRVGMKPEVDGEQDYPGHWVGGYTGRDEYDRDMGVYVLAAFDDGNMTAYEPEVICTPWDESDARLIVEARNNYPAALDEIERLRAELTDARELLTEQEGLAKAAEERIEALEETTRWIPVTENLPDVSEMVIYENFQHSRPVLAKDDTGHYWVAYYCNSSGRLYWDCDGPDSIGIVAYWKPIE
jgi:hypothetical protein